MWCVVCGARVSVVCGARVSVVCGARVSVVCGARVSVVCGARVSVVCGARVSAVCGARVSVVCGARVSAVCKVICYLLSVSPHMPVTLNGGMRMPAWFDVFHLGEGKRYDEEGLTKASSEG